jgi:hypothetical protein
MNDRCPRNLLGLESFYFLLSTFYSLLAFGQWTRCPGLANLLCFGEPRGSICPVETSRSQRVRTGLAGSKMLPLDWRSVYESTG